MQVPVGTETPLAALAARLGPARQTPLGQGVLSAAEAAHGLVRALALDPAGLRGVIDFLTEVGHATDARRQEWALLADVLGLSAAVAGGGRADGATPAVLAGPFYRPGAPDMAPGASLSRDGRGRPLTVAGRVTGPDGAAVAGALVEVWHASEDGLYENQEPDRQPEFNLRGRFRSGQDGAFRFRTIRPGACRLPGDGPVGRLMAALGLPLDRPAHLHFRFSAPGFRPLVTALFDAGDPAVGRDALFQVRPALCVPFRPEGAGWRIDYAFALAPEAAP